MAHRLLHTILIIHPSNDVSMSHCTSSCMAAEAPSVARSQTESSDSNFSRAAFVTPRKRIVCYRDGYVYNISNFRATSTDVCRQFDSFEFQSLPARTRIRNAIIICAMLLLHHHCRRYCTGLGENCQLMYCKATTNLS